MNCWNFTPAFYVEVERALLRIFAGKTDERRRIGYRLGKRWRRAT